MGLEYVVGIQRTLSVWPPGTEPLPAKPRKSMGRPPKLRQRAPNHQPVLAKDLAAALAPKDWQTVPWRDGTKKKLQSRFAAVRVRPANRDFERSEPLPEQWLLIEWPEDEAQPTKYWLGSLAADTSLMALVTIAVSVRSHFQLPTNLLDQGEISHRMNLSGHPKPANDGHLKTGQ